MATPAKSPRHWSTPAFEAELRTWVETVLGPVRLERHKLRPWAAVWKVYAARGIFWAKQNCAANRFEGPLLALLGELAPDDVVAPTAIDGERGLVLTPDHGAVLGPEHDGDLEVWCGLVRRWSLLQRALVDRVEEVARTGVQRLGPRQSVEAAHRRTIMLNALAPGDPRRLSDDGRERIEAALPSLADSAARVIDLGLPMTLNHNDLHGANVFADGRFFDLGDALLSEPMAVLHVPSCRREDPLGVVRDDARVWQLAEAWAEAWADLVTPAQLRDVLPHALRLARVARAEAWCRVLVDLETHETTDVAPAAAAWLGTLADPLWEP